MIPPDPTSSSGNFPTPDRYKKHWRANLTLVGILLLIWFVIAFLLSFVFADALNEWSLGGFPLGFWIAQQGSILSFVLIIFVYALVAQMLDRRYGIRES
ncbi:MAG: DUF4212 domain-containing protein [Verrucomicrobiales bacterium]